MQIFIEDAMLFLSESGFLIAKKLDNSVRRWYNVTLMEFTIAQGRRQCRWTSENNLQMEGLVSGNRNNKPRGVYRMDRRT